MIGTVTQSDILLRERQETDGDIQSGLENPQENAQPTAGSLISKTYRYTPYGELIAGENASEESGFLYNAELYDDVTGLICLRARWYDPEEARFFQPDIVPGDISDPQSLNRYAYVRNNPVRYADPSGEQFNEKADWGGGAAGLAAIGAAAGASSGASLRNRTQRNTTTANSRSVVKAAQTYVANKAAAAAGKKIIQSAKTVAAAAYTAAKTIAKDRSEKRSTYEPLNAPAIPKRKVDTFPWSNVEKARNGGFRSRDASLNGNGSDGACTVKPFPGNATVADKPVLHVFPGQRTNKDGTKSLFTDGVAQFKIKSGDRTPRGREYTKHGAERANERGFDSKKVDDIIDNNYKHRVKEVDKETGEIKWRYQDKRGNTVITNEWGDKIISVYSHPKWVNKGNYISKKQQDG